MSPVVQAFFHEPTNTITYLVWDRPSRVAAIIDPVLDFDAKAGRTGTATADLVLKAAEAASLDVRWILETHAHADHLSAAQYLRRKTGAEIVIGAEIVKVQHVFKGIFNAEDMSEDGRQFDRLVKDGERLALGESSIDVLHTPGHTPACVTYVIGDAAFVGDTLFMPDYGTARADFPGGDARVLYRSIRKILSLPPDTRLFMCHDYKAPNRSGYAWESTVAEERRHNIHVRDDVSEDEFVRQREARDRTLPMPALLLPSIQVNMRAGEMPPADDNGTVYLKLPIDRL